MKRIFLYLICFFITHSVIGQFANTLTVGNNSTLYKSKGGISADSAILWLNSFTDTATANYSVVSKYNSIIRVGNSFWYRTFSPNKWNEFTSGSGGIYVKVSDTSTMLQPYLRKSDTTHMLSGYAKNGQVVKYSDTSAMLNPYLRKTDTAYMLNGYARSGNLANGAKFDTSTLEPRLNLKLNIGDTANMLSGYKTFYPRTSISLTTTGSSGAATYSPTTGVLNIPQYSGATYTANSPITLTGSAFGADTGRSTSQITTGGSLNKVKDSIVSLIPTVSGTTNYVAKFTGSNAVGNSLVFDNGSAVVVNGTSPIGKFNVAGTSHFDLTETYGGSGTSYLGGFTYIPTYTSSLPTSNVSFSTMPIEYHPTFNGATSVGLNTPFGGVLSSSFAKFSSTGTASFNATNPLSGVQVNSLDDGTTNGTITNSAGITVNGIFLTSGSTATITRTNHYQLLLNDIDQYSGGGNVTNKFAIYQVGTNDISRFFGPVQNASSSVQFTSDERVKENIHPFTRGLKEIEQLNTKTFNYIYSKERVSTGLIAQEVEKVIPEAVSKGYFEVPNTDIKYSDFRMIDQTVLFYTLINAIKELNNKVKELENSKK